MSASARISRFNDVNKKEIMFYRSKWRELRNVSIERSIDGVHGKDPRPGDRTHIHTHVVGAYKPKRGVWGIPSIRDIYGMIHYSAAR
jgi:hypothetical protein